MRIPGSYLELEKNILINLGLNKRERINVIHGINIEKFSVDVLGVCGTFLSAHYFSCKIQNFIKH